MVYFNSSCSTKHYIYNSYIAQQSHKPLEKSIIYFYSSNETTSSLPGNYQGTTSKQELSITFTLNKQYRTWPLTYGWLGDTLVVTCKEATYLIPRLVVEQGKGFCWDIPADGAVYKAKGTFGFISLKALRQLKEQGSFVYDGITWRKTGETAEAIQVRADIDRTEMRISLKDQRPLVIETQHNPLGIDWQIEK